MNNSDIEGAVGSPMQAHAEEQRLWTPASPNDSMSVIFYQGSNRAVKTPNGSFTTDRARPATVMGTILPRESTGTPNSSKDATHVSFNLPDPNKGSPAARPASKPLPQAFKKPARTATSAPPMHSNHDALDSDIHASDLNRDSTAALSNAVHELRRLQSQPSPTTSVSRQGAVSPPAQRAEVTKNGRTMLRVAGDKDAQVSLSAERPPSRAQYAQLLERLNRLLSVKTDELTMMEHCEYIQACADHVAEEAVRLMSVQCLEEGVLLATLRANYSDVFARLKSHLDSLREEREAAESRARQERGLNAAVVQECTYEIEEVKRKKDTEHQKATMRVRQDLDALRAANDELSSVNAKLEARLQAFHIMFQNFKNDPIWSERDTLKGEVNAKTAQLRQADARLVLMNKKLETMTKELALKDDEIAAIEKRIKKTEEALYATSHSQHTTNTRSVDTFNVETQTDERLDDSKLLGNIAKLAKSAVDARKDKQPLPANQPNNAELMALRALMDYKKDNNESRSLREVGSDLEQVWGHRHVVRGKLMRHGKETEEKKAPEVQEFGVQTRLSMRHDLDTALGSHTQTQATSSNTLTPGGKGKKGTRARRSSTVTNDNALELRPSAYTQATPHINEPTDAKSERDPSRVWESHAWTQTQHSGHIRMPAASASKSTETDLVIGSDMVVVSKEEFEASKKTIVRRGAILAITNPESSEAEAGEAAKADSEADAELQMIARLRTEAQVLLRSLKMHGEDINIKSESSGSNSFADVVKDVTDALRLMRHTRGKGTSSRPGSRAGLGDSKQNSLINVIGSASTAAIAPAPNSAGMSVETQTDANPSSVDRFHPYIAHVVTAAPKPRQWLYTQMRMLYRGKLMADYRARRAGQPLMHFPEFVYSFISERFAGLNAVDVKESFLTPAQAQGVLGSVYGGALYERGRLAAERQCAAIAVAAAAYEKEWTEARMFLEFLSESCPLDELCFFLISWKIMVMDTGKRGTEETVMASLNRCARCIELTLAAASDGSKHSVMSQIRAIADKDEKVESYAALDIILQAYRLQREKRCAAIPTMCMLLPQKGTIPSDLIHILGDAHAKANKEHERRQSVAFFSSGGGKETLTLTPFSPITYSHCRAILRTINPFCGDEECLRIYRSCTDACVGAPNALALPTVLQNSDFFVRCVTLAGAAQSKTTLYEPAPCGALLYGLFVFHHIADPDANAAVTSRPSTPAAPSTNSTARPSTSSALITSRTQSSEAAAVALREEQVQLVAARQRQLRKVLLAHWTDFKEVIDAHIQKQSPISSTYYILRALRDTTEKELENPDRTYIALTAYRRLLDLMLCARTVDETISETLPLPEDLEAELASWEVLLDIANPALDEVTTAIMATSAGDQR